MLYSPIYAFPYLILIIGYVILSFIEYRCVLSELGKLNIRVICSLSFIFFFGFRGFIGWDWTNYYKLFQETPSIFDRRFLKVVKETFIEKGFITYLALLKQIWNNYHFFIFFNTVVDVLILNFFLKKYVFNYALGFLAFIIMGGFFMETDLLRNAKSIALFLLSIKYLRDRKIFPYFLINIIGMQFHLSAILYLPLYFFLHKKIPRYLFVIIFITGNLIFLFKVQYIKPIVFFLTSLVGGKLSYLARLYFDSSYVTAYGISIGYIERVIMGILVIVCYERILKQTRYAVVFLNAFILYFILFFYFGEAGIIAGRLGELFIFSYWFLWPSIVLCFGNQLWQFAFLGYLYIYTIFKVYGLTHSILYNYDNILFKSKSYTERYRIFNSNYKKIVDN